MLFKGLLVIRCFFPCLPDSTPVNFFLILTDNFVSVKPVIGTILNDLNEGKVEKSMLAQMLHCFSMIIFAFFRCYTYYRSLSDSFR